MTDHTALRAKLIQMRDGALDELSSAEHWSPGLGRVVADTDAVLLVIDRAATPSDVPAGGRIVVSHPGLGQPIIVTVYCGANAIARLDLSPHRAIALAGDLIDAVRHAPSGASTCTPHYLLAPNT